MWMGGRAEGKAGHFCFSDLIDLQGAAEHHQINITFLIIPRAVEKRIFLIDSILLIIYQIQKREREDIIST